MQADVERIEEWVRAGGPRPAEYPVFTAWVDDLMARVARGEVSSTRLSALRECFGRAASEETMQGWVLRKPKGYAGDFEIIDQFYRRDVSPDPALRGWDEYFQAQPSPQAVRNRKELFKQLVGEKAHALGGPPRVLNVASGPCRDLAELFQSHGDGFAHVDCIDSDETALAFARGLLDGISSVRFRQENAVKAKIEERYDLIWSAGLFDYIDDTWFVRLLSRYVTALRPNGELVIGNFHPDHPTRAYIELFDWHLVYRTREDLERLARSAAIPTTAYTVMAEPLGINYFLRIKGPVP